MHMKSALALGFAASLSAALAVDMPADYTHLGWIESTKSTKRTGQDAYNQYIDTGYFPNVGTVIRAKFNLGARNNNWAGVFGAYDVNDNSNNGVAFRFYNNSNMNGLFCNASYGEAQISGVATGVDHEVELKAGSITIDSTAKTITTQDSKLPLKNATLYVFCEDNWNNNKRNPRRGQVLKLYSLTIEDADGMQRQYKPCLNAEGEAGLWDSVAGEFYPNQGDEDLFNYGGMAYKLDPATGVMTVDGGALTAEDVTGVAKVVKVTDREVEAGAFRALDALTVSAGAFSLQDAEAATCAVNGAFTLAGGTTLKFDVAANGVDAISATSLVLDGVTAEKPVTIVVRGLAVTGVSEETPILTGGNLTMADLALFKLEAGLPCDLTVANGNLVLAPKAADAVTWVGGADAKWSTDANWAEGAKPGIGAPVTMTGVAGGTTQQDINGLTIASLTTVADAGSFTHNGSALAVSTKIDNKSTADQTLATPLTLGVPGKNFSTATAGNLTFSQDVQINADKADFAPAADKLVSLKTVSGTGTLAVSGPGTVELTAASPNFSGDVEVTGGTLVSKVDRPFGTDGSSNEIRISNGGTLDLGPSSLAENTINYKQRKLILSGDGVDGKGAVVYNGGKNQYYAFRRAELLDDATVGGTAGRWDIRKQDGVGTFDFNGHSLTKVGGGQFTLSDVAVTTGDKPVTVDVKEGSFLAEQYTNLQGADNVLNIASGAWLKLYVLWNPLEWQMNFAGGATFEGQAGATDGRNRLVGPVTLGEGTTTFKVVANAETSVEGTMSGAGGVKKTDPGTLVFKGGAKTYTGTTEVAAGRLVVSGKDQLPGYDKKDQVSVNGDSASLVLESDASSGWTQDDFTTLFNNLSLNSWRSTLGYQNAGDAPLTIAGPLIREQGGLLLNGRTDAVNVTGDITLTDGLLTLGDKVVISGADTVVSAKRIELTGRDTTVTVRDGATLMTNNKDQNVGDIKIAGEGSGDGNEFVHKLVVNNATVTTAELPAKNQRSSGLLYGTYNSGVGILDIQDGGLVAHKINGSTYEWSRSAAYIREGGRMVNYCGTGNNDGFIAGDSYGYMQNAGSVEVKGWFQICNGSSRANAVGILYNTGDVNFTAEYEGYLTISRGGTGLIYQTDGTIESATGFQFNGQHGAGTGGLAVWTIDGPNAIAKGATFYPVNKKSSTSILTLREGGTMEYGSINPRAANFDSVEGVEAQPFYLNMAGGYLKPRATGNLFKDGERYQPNALVAFEGGAGFDVGEGLTATLNYPISKPTGKGVASVELPDDILKEEYIGAPFVRISGDGFGATAVAIYDDETRRVTGVKVTSPGCGYTEAAVSIEGGRRHNNTAFTTATATLTDETPVYGGLRKRGSGTLVVSSDVLPEGKAPLALEGGVLDLGGVDYEASDLILAGGLYTNGSVVADRVVSATDVQATITAATGSVITYSTTGVLAFPAGTTVTVDNMDDLCKDENVVHVLVETAGGITGFENLTFTNPAPKGWQYSVKGNKLILARKRGFTIIIR